MLESTAYFIGGFCIGAAFAFFAIPTMPRIGPGAAKRGKNPEVVLVGTDDGLPTTEAGVKRDG